MATQEIEDVFDVVNSVVVAEMETTKILLEDGTTWAEGYNYQKDAVKMFMKYGNYRSGMTLESPLNASCTILSSGIMRYSFGAYKFSVEAAEEKYFNSFGFEKSLSGGKLLKMTRENGSTSLLFFGADQETPIARGRSEATKKEE